MFKRIPGYLENELMGDEIPDTGSIQAGTVGWLGDPVVEETSEAMTLIKITLFEGYPLGQPQSTEGFANGYQILARLSAPNFMIPQKGKQVVVAIPAGMSEVPGAAVVIAYPDESPNRQFKKESTVLDFGSEELIIKAKRITLFSEDGELRPSLTLGNGNIQMLSNGSGIVITSDAKVAMKSVDNDGALKTQVICTSDSIQLLDAAGMSMLKLKDGNCSMSGKNISINFSVIGLGQNASPATPVVVGLTGQTGVGSLTIFGSP